jgi:hypothetical protein
VLLVVVAAVCFVIHDPTMCFGSWVTIVGGLLLAAGGDHGELATKTES